MPYYSQNGEDLVIDAAFDGARSGFFVEVGCIDGRRFSNTLALEERGWRGICVEAHAGYIELIRAARPGSAVVHCAIGDRDEALVPFYANARGALSTLDRSLEGLYSTRYAEWFHGFEEQRIGMRAISSLLDELGAPAIDVLSVDIEGCDVLAIRGLDLKRHRPRLIVVEADDAASGDEIDGMLLPAGYSRGPMISGNAFYLAERAMLDRLGGRTIRGVVKHTRHPMDRGTDVERAVEIHIDPKAAA